MPTSKKAPSKKQSSVLIVDDHPIVREGLRQLINDEDDLTVCAEAAEASQALKALQSSRPELAIVDISLEGLSGVELVKKIHAQYPDIPILILSIHEESLYAERLLRAGARGYVMKSEGTESLITAIRRVLAGEIYLSEKLAVRMAGKLVGQPGKGGSPIERLSDRELEVFSLLGRGLGTRQIAERLFLSVKTIETYRENIKRKLNLKGAAELIQHAVQWVQSGESF